MSDVASIEQRARDYLHRQMSTAQSFGSSLRLSLEQEQAIIRELVRIIKAMQP